MRLGKARAAVPSDLAPPIMRPGKARADKS